MASDEFLSPRDSDGHGTHTATTAAGREVRSRRFRHAGCRNQRHGARRVRRDLQGLLRTAVATRAASCFFSDSAAATEAAVTDGVDVLSFSIGTASEFNDPTGHRIPECAIATACSFRARGQRRARPEHDAAGEPWAMTVAASTPQRQGIRERNGVNSPASVARALCLARRRHTRPLAGNRSRHERPGGGESDRCLRADRADRRKDRVDRDAAGT